MQQIAGELTPTSHTNATNPLFDSGTGVFSTMGSNTTRSYGTVGNSATHPRVKFDSANSTIQGGARTGSFTHSRNRLVRYYRRDS